MTNFFHFRYISFDKIKIEYFRQYFSFTFPNISLIHDHRIAKCNLKPIFIKMRLLHNIVLLRCKKMFDESGIYENQCDHIWSIANDYIDIFPVVFLIVKAISVLFLVVSLVFDKHDFMCMIRKGDDVVAHHLESFFVPFH